MNVATKYRISGHVTPGKTGRYVILTQSLPLPGGSIYELSWHQAMQRLPRNRCLATGYSCRSQVKRVEGTGVRHPVQALLEIIK